MLVAVIGFLPDDQVSAAPSSTVVDLDTADPGTPLEAPESGAVAVLARTHTDLRRAVSLAALLPKATRVVVAVATAQQALPVVAPDWPDLRSFQVRRGAAGEWAADATFARARPAGDVVVALAGGHRLQAWPPPRVALAGPGAAHWRPGDPAVTLTTAGGPLDDPEHPPPADLVLRLTGPDPVPWTDARVRVVDRPQSGSPGTGVDAVPPVDERSVNPGGFVSTPELGSALLTWTGDHWAVQVDPENLVRFPVSGAVTDADVARLRQLRSVAIGWDDEAGSISAVRVVAGLAAAGVPLHAAYVPPAAGGALGAELAGLLTGAGEQDLADDLRREEHSVRLRRAALRTHSTEARWRNLAAAAGLAVPAAPKISVVLCTRRPEFLGFALAQIARQRHVDLELILTLHGIPADLPEVKEAVAEFDRPITVIEVPADVPFGAALNQGVARSAGRYVAKWDDDDWYADEFLADMLLASSYTGAELVGCKAQFVYLGQIDLTIYRAGRSEWMSRWLAGGTFVMERSAFETVGGFPLVSRHVDAALLDALLAAGARTYSTHGLGYALHRRVTGHTWNQPVTYFLRAAARQWRGPRFSAFIDPAGTPLPSLDVVPK
jgi:hypothetical protein